MIGVGYCTKQSDINIDDFMPGLRCIEYKENRENEEDKPWGCAYHGDDGHLFCSESGKPYGKPYGPTYSAGDTIGFYLNLRNNDKMIFYTKNGVNLDHKMRLPRQILVIISLNI
ncbi:hypothetical protein C2G38_2079807 [Gigaspora rosea]|uniref:SPRY domain-containing protein n=1 Tax=Gigaspora rosea TaxID=44941 RepID=A0A397VLR9_9GLOM|nr:hypothetical protein C2G38_2079807 [Gigaspora rosea]